MEEERVISRFFSVVFFTTESIKLEYETSVLFIYSLETPHDRKSSYSKRYIVYLFLFSLAILEFISDNLILKDHLSYLAANMH